MQSLVRVVVLTGLCASLLPVSVLVPMAVAQDEPVYSGPQPGEAVAAFPLTGVFGDQADQNIDLVGQAGDGPLLLVFVHERTRPAFALCNAVMRFAAERRAQGLMAGMVFLSADPTETRTWLNNVSQHLPRDVAIGVSPDGLEGPGMLGLNRQVSVTVLVIRERRVSANFALVQPSVNVDGPKILQAVVAVTGGGDVPDISRYLAAGAMAARGGRPATGRPQPAEQDPNLRSLLTPLINRMATRTEVDAAAQAIVDYAERHPAAKQQIADIATRIIEAGKLENYGTPPAQEYLRKWSTEFQSPRR